jgi:hypothetical protein
MPLRRGFPFRILLFKLRTKSLFKMVAVFRLIIYLSILALKHSMDYFFKNRGAW